MLIWCFSLIVPVMSLSTWLLSSHQYIRMISWNSPFIKWPRNDGIGIWKNKVETICISHTHRPTNVIRCELDQIKWALCAVSPWQSPRRFSLRFGPFFASSPPRFRETPRICLLGCKPLRPNPNPSSFFSPPKTHRKSSLPDRWGGGRSAAWRPWRRRVAGSSSTSSSIPPPVSSEPRPGLFCSIWSRSAAGLCSS